MSAPLKWWFAHLEGDLIQYVSLEDLTRAAAAGAVAFGADKGTVRVVYDRVLAARGIGPFQKIDLENFLMETRAYPS